MTNESALQPGFRAAQWRMLLVTMFCYFFYYTGRQTWGFAIPAIQEELGLSKETLGWIGAGLLWAYALGQAINGNLGDKFGGRIMMSLGAILSCAFNWVVSFGTTCAGLACPMVANGFAQSMGWAPGSRVLSNWFGHHERGRAFGFYMLAASLSSVLAFVTPLVVLRTLGLNWRWIFRLPVLLLLVGGAAYYVIVRNKPEDLGYSAPSDPGAGGVNEAGKTPADDTSLYRYLAVLKNWRFMVACVGIFFQSTARYGLLTWVPVHFLGADWKHSSAAWISIALPIGMALGAVTGGWVSDKLFRGVRWKVVSLFMVLGAIMSLVMFGLPRGHWIGMVVLFACGFFAYGCQSAFWALGPDLLGTKRSGTGIGVMNFFAYLAAGLVNPYIGGLIDRYDNTALVFPVVAGACAICAVTGVFIKR
jgi:MFS transporter, OPA family, glycerol-3-phosphate transporter